MAGFSLKPGVRLNADSTGSVLIDTDLCRTVRLSPQQTKVIQLCDRHRSAEEITTACQQADSTIDAKQVQSVLHHFKEEGFLHDQSDLSDVEIKVEEAQPSPNRAVVDPIPLLSDSAPRLRSDLQIKPKATGELGLVEITDTRTGKTFVLYDFEASIARMLSGERRIVEVIEAAAKIGIPVTLESFQKFVRQLRAYGFLDDAPASPDRSSAEAQTTWAPREEWSHEVRQLFQSALKMFRLKRLTEAGNYADAILAIDPKNAEAQDMRKRIDKALASLDAMIASESAPAENPEPPPNFEDLYGKESPAEPAPPKDYRPITAERAGHRLSRRRTQIIVGSVAAAMLAGVAFYPWPQVLKVDAKISPIFDVALRAPRDGVVRSLFVHERQWVKSGTKLLELDTRSSVHHLEAAKKALRSANDELNQFQLRTDSVQQLRAKVDQLKAERDGLRRRSGAKLVRLKKKLAAAESELRRAQKELERTAPADQEAELKEKVQRAESEKARLEKEVAGAEITAPRDGIVVGLVEAKSEVHAGQPLARTQDINTLRVKLKVADSDAHLVENNQPVSVTAPNLRQEFKGRVSLVSDSEDQQGIFEATISNPERLSLDPNGQAVIHCGEQSLGQVALLRIKRMTIPVLHAALR